MKSLRLLVSLAGCTFGTAVALAANPVPLSPTGRLDGVRRPLFTWTATGTNRYTLDLRYDAFAEKKVEVTFNSFMTPSDLSAGFYRWRVKEGGSLESGTWSPFLSFTIPPLTPNPSSPIGWVDAPSTNPVFRFSSGDPDVTHFSVQLFSGDTVLGTRTVLRGTKAIAYEVAWTSAIPMGSYAWRVRAIHIPLDPALKVASDWSYRYALAVGVPFETEVTSPDGSLAPGWQNVTVHWIEVAGAVTYNIRLIHNGKTLATVYDRGGTECAFSRYYDPGYYSAVVMARNWYGHSPWSQPHTFTVRRVMLPDNDAFFAVPPDRFEWTRSAAATRYRLRLHRYDPPSGNYRPFHETWIQPAHWTPVWISDLDIPKGAYRWSITDFTGDQPLYTSTAFFEVLIPGRPVAISPLGPVDGHRDLAFAWGAPLGSPSHYQVQVWRKDRLLKDSGWQPATNFLKFVSPQAVYSFPSNAAGHCRWRIRARNAAGAGAWRESRFSLATLDTPTIIYPIDGSLVMYGDSLYVEWPKVPGAVRYEVEFRDAGGVIGTVSVGDLPGVQHIHWPAYVLGEIAVRVRAGETGWSPWSQSRTFTVEFPQPDPDPYPP